MKMTGAKIIIVLKQEKQNDCWMLQKKNFRGCGSSVKKYYTTTPLSYRDYIGNGDGSMYGFAKDFNKPLKSMMSPRTKLPNLYLTGQNLNAHGILGTTSAGY